MDLQRAKQRQNTCSISVLKRALVSGLSVPTGKVGDGARNVNSTRREEPSVPRYSGQAIVLVLGRISLVCRPCQPCLPKELLKSKGDSLDGLGSTTSSCCSFGQLLFTSFDQKFTSQTFPGQQLSLDTASSPGHSRTPRALSLGIGEC